MPPYKPPVKPPQDATPSQISQYNQELVQYKMHVQAVASEIEQKCRALIGICQEIQVPPMYVMDNVSLSLWQGRAAFEFQDAGTAQNKACSQVAQELNEMALAAVNKTNAKLSTI